MPPIFPTEQLLKGCCYGMDSSAEQQPPNSGTPRPPDPRPLWVAVFLTAFGMLFFWNVWERDFWDPNEPRFALIAASMDSVESARLPSLDGAPYFHLPPLTYWLARGSELLTGLDPRVSYRLPVVLLATLGLWLTYLCGKRLADGRVGLLAAAIQASTVGYFRRAAWLDDDLVFAVFCQLALVSFLFALEGRRSRYWSWVGWVGLAGAAMTKSLFLGTGLVVGSLACCIFLDPKDRGVRRSLGSLLSLPGLALFLLLVAPWYGWILAEHGTAFLTQHIVGHHFERLLDAESHRRLPYYYLINIATGFLPWTIFLPLGFLHCKDRIRRPCERFALFSILFPLIVLSFVSSKKPGYILLVWPSLSLAVAAGLFETKEIFSLWEEYLRDFVSRLLPWLLRLPLVLVALLGLLHLAGYLPQALAAVFRLSEAEIPRLEALFPQDETTLYGLGFLALVTALLAGLSVRVQRAVREEQPSRAAFEFACGVCFLFFATSFFYEGMNKAKSPRYLVGTFAPKVGEEPLKVYGTKRPSFQYYYPRQLDTLNYPDPLVADDPAIKKLRQYLEQDAKVYLLASAGDLEKLTQLYGSLSPSLIEQGRGHLGWTREYVLLSNRP